MQSIIQYRKSGKLLREQVERHSAIAVAGLWSTADEHEKHHVGLEEQSNIMRAHAPPYISGIESESHHSAIGDFQGPISSEAPEDPEERVLESPGPAFVMNVATMADKPPDELVLNFQDTVGTMGSMLARAMSGVNIRFKDEIAASHGAGETKLHVFVVGYMNAVDPMNPHNWSVFKRTSATVLVSLISLTVGFASTIVSVTIPQAKAELKVSTVTESLATGLFLIGWGCGAFFTTPVSETVGRNPVYVVTLTIFMIFIMASALAPNIGTQLAFRTIAGFFGSAPSTVAGGSISDLWTPMERTFAFPLLAGVSFWGVILGAVVGGYIGQASSEGLVSWRWTEWVTLIWSGFILILLVFFLPETYSPRLLKWKASHLRDITGDDRYKSPLELQETRFVDRLLHNIHRPFSLFATEPIVVLLTLYITLVYIVLYTFFTGYGFIFADIFQLNQGLTYLCFMGIGVGFFLSIATVPWVYVRYSRMLAAAQKQGGTQLEPEQRLIYVIIGAPFLPVGMLWMAWTSYATLGPWSAIVATIPIGFAMMAVYISVYQYLIDAFELEAANALVMVTFVRYVASGVMIPVSIPMYENLGVHWTLTLLAAIALLMTPVPFIFYKHGKAIRMKSRNATKQ